MKKNLSSVCGLAVLVLFVARNAYASDAYQVHPVPAIEPVVKKMTPAQQSDYRKNLTVATKFLSAWYDGSAAITTSEQDEISAWNRKVAPLISVSRAEWEARWGDESLKISPANPYNWYYLQNTPEGGLPSFGCDYAKLVAISTEAKQMKLTFEVTLLGTYGHRFYPAASVHSHSTELIFDQKGKIHEIDVSSPLIPTNYRAFPGPHTPGKLELEKAAKSLCARDNKYTRY